ncbi:hypothetical protein J1N35_014638 [Gossypium stocksii]|uniref:Uncharacterized protein n=1 Tax=Gossypium stocksii TaxID=47602 RepID=A0A9D4AA34_9ROSI|nr:hypothetical protein J1N35_014638 [Gossypium stocksii]
MDDAFEVMVMALEKETMALIKALNTRIEELEGELTMYRAIVGKGVLGATLNHEINVSKQEKFKRARSVREVICRNLIREIKLSLTLEEFILKQFMSL